MNNKRLQPPVKTFDFVERCFYTLVRMLFFTNISLNFFLWLVRWPKNFSAWHETFIFKTILHKTIPYIENKTTSSFNLCKFQQKKLNCEVWEDINKTFFLSPYVKRIIRFTLMDEQNKRICAEMESKAIERSLQRFIKFITINEKQNQINGRKICKV